MDRRDRPLFDNLRQRPALRIVELGRNAWRLAVDQAWRTGTNDSAITTIDLGPLKTVEVNDLAHGFTGLDEELTLLLATTSPFLLA